MWIPGWTPLGKNSRIQLRCVTCGDFSPDICATLTLCVIDQAVQMFRGNVAWLHNASQLLNEFLQDSIFYKYLILKMREFA